MVEPAILPTLLTLLTLTSGIFALYQNWQVHRTGEQQTKRTDLEEDYARVKAERNEERTRRLAAEREVEQLKQQLAELKDTLARLTAERGRSRPGREER